MSYISSSPPIGILCVIGLYFIFLLFLIIVEIKNNNSKAKSFIWFFSSLIIHAFSSLSKRNIWRKRKETARRQAVTKKVEKIANEKNNFDDFNLINETEFELPDIYVKNIKVFTIELIVQHYSTFQNLMIIW